jgi:hypothetical protein
MDMVSPKGIMGTPERLAQLIAGQVVNLVLESLDFDAILDRININALLGRIDLNELLEQIDLNALLSQVDLNDLIKGLDLDALIEQLQIETLIARSTSSAMGAALDVLRRQSVGLDDFVARSVNRLGRRKPGTLPLGPALLVSGPPQPSATSSSS